MLAGQLSTSPHAPSILKHRVRDLPPTLPGGLDCHLSLRLPFQCLPSPGKHSLECCMGLASASHSQATLLTDWGG